MAKEFNRHTDAEMDGLSRLSSMLGDKTRLRILRLLANGERDVGGIVVALRVRQPTVSHHLALLRTMYLVSSRRAGKRVVYRLGNSARVEAAESLSLLMGKSVMTISSSG